MYRIFLKNRLNVQDVSEKSVFKLFWPTNVVVELKSVSTAVITRKLWNRKTTLRIMF